MCIQTHPCISHSSDLRDGVLLIQLLKNLSGKRVSTTSSEEPRDEEQERKNVRAAFGFMKTEGLNLVNIGKPFMVLF